MTYQSLSEYLRNVRAIQWFICVVPLGGWVLRGSLNRLFPLVGSDDANILCLTLATILAGVGAILPWAIDISKVKLPVLLSCTALLICAAIVYFHLSEKYVITIPLPTGEKLSVSIGSERSQAANDYVKEGCPNCSDAELLIAVGPYENEVHKLWTESSIDAVRLEMFVSYAATLFLLNLIVGVLAKTNRASSNLPVAQPPRNPEGI